jgi:phytoene dehydrogenase-like protein
MRAKHVDAVILGAGHNGLTAAAYLARSGRKVLVLERRAIAGGCVVTEELASGMVVDSVWAGGHLRPAIVKELALHRFGYPAHTSRPAFVSVLSDRDRLILEPDGLNGAEAIKRFAPKDAARWPDFVRSMNQWSKFLDAAYATIMPRVPRGMSLEEGLGLIDLGLDLRLMGRREMLNLIRMLPMTAAEFLDEWFESDVLKGALASLAIHGVTLGPMSAGTGWTLLHTWMNRGGLAHANVGRAGAIAESLAAAVTAAGGEIRTNAEVARIRVDTLECTGVQLTEGEEIAADMVLSAADPKRTFLSLVGAVDLPPEFVWKVQSIKMRGSVAKLHLLTDGAHGIPDGTVVVAPNLQYLEHAYDAAKYGRLSDEPYLEITTSGRTVSVHIQFAPYRLREAEWNESGKALESRVMKVLSTHFPNLPGSVVERRLLTPLDLEQIYGATEGDLNHGQLMLDQFLFMRPIPGWSNHKTPVDNLFLCGSGVHGGGGLSGAAGRNAARAVLRASRFRIAPPAN